MKNPPTLADACAATRFDKRFTSVRAKFMQDAMYDVVMARKFVLDRDMSRYLAELSNSFWSGGLRKRNRMLDNARQMARLPHALTWIEFEFKTGYYQRSCELGVERRRDIYGKEPAKFGWLIQQHPKVETSFRCIEIHSGVHERYLDRAFIHPVAMAWSSTNDPIYWPKFKEAIDKDAKDSEWIAGCEGYVTDLVRYTPAYDSEAAALDMLASMAPPEGSEIRKYPGWEAYVFPRLHMRDTWALLATVNDLPIKVEHIEPSKGYIARGSYKKFLKHSVIHLTVPEIKWRKLVLKTAIALRRRAHQVRGHWRVDWHARPSKICNHEWVPFGSTLVCQRCQGHKMFIHEHQRGDASLGFVTHDYEVHRDSKT